MKPFINTSILLLLLAAYAAYAAARQVPLAASSIPSNKNRRWGNNRATRLVSGTLADDDDDEDDRFSKPAQLTKRARFYSVPRYSAMRPNERNGVWSGRLLVVNIIAFAVQSYYPPFTAWGVKLSDKIRNGEQLYRLVTPMFLHGGFIHLLTNSYSLQAVGPDVEQYFGSGRFLATYLVSGIAGNYLSAMRSPNPALGASGAVFGIVGAYFAFLNRNEELFGQQGEHIQSNLVRTIGINLIMGAVSPMIDQWGHVGGFIGGIAMASTFGPKLSLVGLPGGGSALIDDPVLRLPRYLESIPEQIGTRIEKMKRRMQVTQHKANLPAKPWRMNRPPTQYRKQLAPNRSIRPAI